MVPIIRHFTQKEPPISPSPEGTIEEFFHHNIIVVLGEPGLGKTTTFEYAAKQEPNAEFVRIGEFLSAHTIEYLRGKVLYLDGLDEHRSRANGTDVMDALISRLKSIASTKVRISCRTAEWHGGKDIGILSTISDGSPVVQLYLKPLSKNDILNLIPNADAFVEGAISHHLDKFLENPQDFLLLHEFYSENKQWPNNRSELMHGACKALLKELNKIHYEAVDDWVTDKDLTRASDYLAAILILSDIEGISSNRTTATVGFPAIHEFDGDLFAMRVATGRHVFKPAEHNRIEYKHRTIAEYMAARYLATRVREGLSLRRVIALMTGEDGGTPPELRGVYAWLVTMLSGLADHVLIHDPYGAIIYGDTYSWTPNTKISAFKALIALSEKDPWFRGQDRSSKELGGLSDPVLIKDFELLLREDKCNTHILTVVFDAISNGENLTDIGDELLNFIRNAEKPIHLRSRAVDAFSIACPNRTTDLLQLISEVHSSSIIDHEQYLLGALLQYLYPKFITPDTILEFLVKPSAHIIGWYNLFISHKLFNITDANGLRSIANSLLLNKSSFLYDDQYYGNAFTGKLISRLLEAFGESASTEELFIWLTLGLDSYGLSRIENDDAKSIHTFLENHNHLYNNLFFYFFDTCFFPEKKWHQVLWRFRSFTAGTVPHYDFPKTLLTHLNQESNIDKACAFFEISCCLAMNTEPSLSSVNIEMLEIASKINFKFPEILERHAKCDIEEWRQKDAMQKKQRIEEQTTRQSRNIASLIPYKETIMEGTALGILDHYAKIWFGLFADVNQELLPKERIKELAGNEYAEYIKAGFINALHRKVFNSVQDIAETDTANQTYHRGFLMLAAMDLIAEKGKANVLDLPDSILRIAIAYNMANYVDSPIIWHEWLLEERPDLITSVMAEYWHAQLSKEAETLTNFYTFNDQVRLAPFVKEILPNLLTHYPKAHPKVLKPMLLSAIKLLPNDILLLLVENALANRFDQLSGQRTMWILTGFTVDQEKYLVKLNAQLRKYDKDKWLVHKFLIPFAMRRNNEGNFYSSIQCRKIIIEVLGNVFSNTPFPLNVDGGWVGEEDESYTAQEIKNLIHTFAQDSSDNAASALSDLFNNSKLAQWHSEILNTIANQIRTAREANFTRANVSDVISTLSNAEPTNVTDLKALVMDALNDVASEIRHGNTDGYKTFWNIGEHGKATDIHIDENTARDRLLDLLRPKLRHLDIAVEPEVRYADEKRADIAIYSRNMKLPIEIKRDGHPKIWTAAENQLKMQYSRDPASEGNGIYLLFWLNGKSMATPPKGINKPANAKDLEDAIKKTIPKASTGLIDVIVIDVSIPENKMASDKKSKKHSK